MTRRLDVRSDREIRVPLHELADMRTLLETELYFSEGELSPTMEREWDRISGSARQKVYRFGLWVCEQDASIAAIDHEMGRLAERRRAIEKRVASRKVYIAPIMERLGIRHVEGPLCTVTLHQNSSLSVTAGAAPQNDLFASPLREAHHPRADERRERGHHVRIR